MVVVVLRGQAWVTHAYGAILEIEQAQQHVLHTLLVEWKLQQQYACSALTAAASTEELSLTLKSIKMHAGKHCTMARYFAHRRSEDLWDLLGSLRQQVGRFEYRPAAVADNGACVVLQLRTALCASTYTHNVSSCSIGLLKSSSRV